MKRYPALGMVAIMTLALCACDGQSKSGSSVGMNMPATRVTVVKMEQGPVELFTEMAGRTVSYRKAEVRPQVRGLIREQCFQEGSDVKQGDVLYRIERDSYEAAYDSAKASLSKAEATMAAAKLKDQRTAQLFKTNSVSQQDYDDTRATFLQAQAEVSLCQAALRTAQINMERTEISAPISGRIGKSSVSVGTLVTADQATALATIHQMDPMNVDLTQAADEVRTMRRQAGLSEMPEQAEQEAELETAVKLILNDGTRYAKPGKLRFADVGVDETTGTVTIRAEFPNSGHELLSGMFVRAEVSMGNRPDALLVPQRAIMRDSRGNPFVYVAVTEGQTTNAVRRAVVLGQAVGSNWLVLDGLKAGENIVLGGAHNVRPDGPVTVTETLSLKAASESADTTAAAEGGK